MEGVCICSACINEDGTISIVHSHHGSTYDTFWIHYQKIESRHVYDSSPCVFFRAHGEAILRRVLFLVHGEVMVCRVPFSATRRSQASPCAFFLAHGEVIVRRVFFWGTRQCNNFFLRVWRPLRGGCGVRLCRVPWKGTRQSGQQKIIPCPSIFFPNPQATCCSPC